jgi:hypothetical protein
MPIIVFRLAVEREQKSSWVRSNGMNIGVLSKWNREAGGLRMEFRGMAVQEGEDVNSPEDELPEEHTKSILDSTPCIFK